MQKRTAFTVLHLLVIAAFNLPFVTFADDSNLNEGSTAAEINISSNNQGYSLSARQARLSDILYELETAADFELKIFEKLNDERSDWNYESMSLTQLLNNLLRDYNTVMLYEKSQHTPQANTDRKLKELWLIASDDDNTPAQPSSRNIEIKLDQPDTTTGIEQKLSAEQQYEIKHIENLEGLTGDDVIESLQQTLLTEQDPVIRRRAVNALGKIGGTQVLDALESGLADNSGDVRTELARSFAGIQDQRSILALGQMSVGDEDIEVRQQAVRALGQQDSPAARAFIEAALNDEAKSVQQIAREILQ